MLNKQQTKIAALAIQHANNGNTGAAARVLSSLHRSALKRSQQDAILKLALAYSLASNSDFVIC
jgi:Flp pilus assembly protein TadD